MSLESLCFFLKVSFHTFCQNARVSVDNRQRLYQMLDFRKIVLRLLIIHLFLPFGTDAMAVGPPMPAEFVGDWVSKEAFCEATVRLRVEVDTVTLINGSDSQEFGDLHLCYSCEGGARYGGEVVWLMPEFNKLGSAKRGPFTIRFNADEEKGITVIDIMDKSLKKRFPLHELKLIKCPSNK
jgi:hypothetical protein